MSSWGGQSTSKATARSNATGLQEDDDCLAWLQYPTDDAFDKGYCCDFFQGGWPPSTVTDKLAIDVFSHGQEGSVSSFSPTGSPPSSSVMQKHMGVMRTGLSSRPSRKVDAEEALAQGAARAAGLSWPSGAEPLVKLRTVMQPPAGGAIKQNLPLPAVPASTARALQSAKNPKAHMLDSHPPSKFNPAAASASTSASSKRSRIQYESHSHLQPESSRITEAGTPMRGYESVVADDDQAWARTSVSCSGASQTSMSLSGNEKLYIEKLKQEDSEFLLDDFTEDDFPRAQKQSKYSLKRNRVPEFHNLSERLRRNKINEKLKALQDLIPNSSKTDKASVLDEAIEYMKALQTQLQMVSMRNSLNASTITMPMSLPQTCLTMPQPQSIGIGVPLGHLGTGTVFGGMADMSLPMPPALFQCPTAVMSQMNAIPFHSQIMAGFTHLGVPQNAQILPTIANIQKKPTSIHWHQDIDQGWPLLQQPRMIEDETASIKQDDCSE